MKKVKLLLLVCSFLLLNIAVSAQTRTITGTVKDSKTGEPVPGATIKVLNSKFGTSADEKGSKEITVAAAADLSVALKEIAANYEKQSGVQVELSFAASGALTQQI